MSTRSPVYTESFEKDAGYRLCRDGVSVLARGCSLGRRLSTAENIALSSHLDRYFDQILGHPARNASAQDVPLTKSDFVQSEKGPLFKFLNDQTWEFLKNGSFKFGTAAPFLLAGQQIRLSASWPRACGSRYASLSLLKT